MRTINLNITREQAADFIEWLALDDYWGHTLTEFDINHGKEKTTFLINGHELSNYSNQKSQLVIDGCYVTVGDFGCYVINGKRISNLDYCLSRLGF